MFFKLYVIALPVFMAIDLLWVGVLARNFYKKQIGFMMADKVNWVAAIIFYVLFLAALIVFVVEPAITERNIAVALWKGALFGLITYGTYDLTNLATLKDWPVTIVIVDMIWGATLAASVSAATYFIAVKLEIL
jgi:uncharacterized membrane protein